MTLSLEIQLREGSPTLLQSNWEGLGIMAIKTERTQVYFRSLQVHCLIDVFVAIASLLSSTQTDDFQCMVLSLEPLNQREDIWSRQ